MNDMARLNPTDIARATGMSKPALDRFLAHDENRALFGGHGKPPTYPVENLPMFVRLHDLHAAGKVTPRTLAANFSPVLPLRIEDSEITNIGIRNPALTAIPLFSESLQTTLLEEIRDAIRTQFGSIDKLLTPAQASVYLACSPGSVSRYVKPVRRGKYRLSDIQAYIRGLGGKDV